MFQYSLPARRTNNGLDNVLVQYPTAFRTFFAEELLNRQVLVGYLFLSYNDNLLRRKRKNRTLNRSKPFLPKLCSQRQLGNEAVVTLRGTNQPRTQRPRPRLISNFFLTLLYWWWRHLYSYVFNVYYFTINVTQITVCGLRSAVCSVQSAVCKCHTPSRKPLHHDLAWSRSFATFAGSCYLLRSFVWHSLLKAVPQMVHFCRHREPKTYSDLEQMPTLFYTILIRRPWSDVDLG